MKGFLFTLLILFSALRPTWAAPQEDTAEFKKAFEAALAVKDNKGMDRALRRHKEAAINVFRGKAEARSLAPGKQLNIWLDGFIQSWDRTFRSDFARNYDRYLQLMDSRRRKTRDRLVVGPVTQINTLHIRAINEKSQSLWLQVHREIDLLIANLEKVGDLYFIAFAYNIKGNSYNPVFNDESGDYEKSLAAYEKVLENRKKLELTQDRFFSDVKGQVDEIRARLGIADPETGEVRERKIHPEEIQPIEGAEWVEVSMKNGKEKKPGSIQHSCDQADMHRLSWFLTSFGKVGDSSELPFIEPKVRLKRVAALKFVLEAGAEPSEEFRLSDKPVVVEYQRKHENGTIDTHALMLAGGNEQDVFQGANLNLKSAENGGPFFFRGIATRNSKTPYGELTLFDTNADGKFGYEKMALVGANGLPENQFLYRYDGILLGKSKHSQPFGPWIANDKGDWFQVQMTDFASGSAIKLLPVKPNLGTVKVSMKGLKGPKLTSLVLSSTSSHCKGLVVDVMAAKRGTMDLPIGRYVVLQGLIQDQKKGWEALIFPPQKGKGLPIYVEIEQDQTTEVKLGAPFHLGIQHEYGNNSLTLSGRTLEVVGNLGERYLRIVGEPLWDMEVQLKGAKGEDFGGSGVDDINKEWGRAYYPPDKIVSFSPGKKPSFRLYLKKHPWFGQLTSEWVEPKD
ncbi:MAG: hypothetical protein DWQ01_11910 [Planctomycetota bacterium]|nr:MAG: hypothetical protein DWQ01_11910 [Planctomycetota bacterium]